MSYHTKPTVLFIDDQVERSESFGDLLRENGLDVVFATNFEMAAKAITHANVDLILCDINLNPSNPNDRSGVQIAEIARRTQPGVPIVAITAFFGLSEFSEYEKSLFAAVYAKASISPADWDSRIVHLRSLALTHKLSSSRAVLLRAGGGGYDVFLCHNSSDKPVVRRLARALARYRIKPWYDEWELVPGRPWQEALEETISDIESAAILIGKSGVGPWADREMRAFLGEFVRRGISLIPVMLPGAPATPELPVFLREFTWVDLRAGIRKSGIEKLIWGIKGTRVTR